MAPINIKKNNNLINGSLIDDIIIKIRIQNKEILKFTMRFLKLKKINTSVADWHFKMNLQQQKNKIKNKKQNLLQQIYSNELQHLNAM